MRTLSAVLGILILAGAILAVGYFFLYGAMWPAVTPFDPKAALSIPSSVAVPRAVPPGQKEYHSDPHHFSILYPEHLSVSRQDATGNATTFTFQDIKTEQGFQIYIVPYQEAQVSEAQFKKDIPSGVRTDLQSITIDGATGATFHSTDAHLGETNETWFVRQGWLYEITTLRPLESWFAPILQTWRFI